MPSAYFFLSDICGYTAYLTGAELEHAQEILNTLFETLLNHLQPPLKIAKLEGDAIFAYLPAEQIAHGQTILDTVENMYAGFRQVQKAMHLNTTCTCRACQGINSLDLKFFLHYGEYAVQRLLGQEELAGPAVILAHRLMKNSVGEKTGLRAYALLTEAAIQAMQAQTAAASFVRHSESYEHLGEVPVYLYDLHPFWEQAERQRRVRITPEAADATAVLTVPAPPAIVWDILTNPATRSQVVAGEITAHGLQYGRIGVGSTYHCAHHDGTATEELIVDWQPLEYITTQERAMEPGMTILFLMTTWVEPLPEACSRVTITFGRPQSEDPAQQAALEAMWPEASRMVLQHFEQHATEAYRTILATRQPKD